MPLRGQGFFSQRSSLSRVMGEPFAVSTVDSMLVGVPVRFVSLWQVAHALGGSVPLAAERLRATIMRSQKAPMLSFPRAPNVRCDPKGRQLLEARTILTTNRLNSQTPVERVSHTCNECLFLIHRPEEIATSHPRRFSRLIDLIQRTNRPLISRLIEN